MTLSGVTLAAQLPTLVQMLSQLIAIPSMSSIDPRFDCYQPAATDITPGASAVRAISTCHVNDQQGTITMQTKTIFLASSAELAEDRKEFEIFINRKNKDWVDQGVLGAPS